MNSQPNPAGQGIPENSSLAILLTDALSAFYRDRQAAGLAAGSLTFYRKKLDPWAAWCAAAGCHRLGDVTADLLRAFLLEHHAGGHTPGGVHACYRALRAFWRWVEAEYEPTGWRNPIKRVPAPRVPQELLPPADSADIAALIATCSGQRPTDARDRAALMLLLDTGLRAAELLALNIGDLDPADGRLLIRRGKGGKGRVAFIGRKTRRAVRRYLTQRPPADQQPAAPLWVGTDGDRLTGDRLTYEGLRSMVRRRAALAGIKAPPLHSFRRAFAIACLRAGVDLRTLQELMGHSSLAMLIRYTRLATDDLAAAHQHASPVDNLL